jgi:hypothetical protein
MKSRNCFICGIFFLSLLLLTSCKGHEESNDEDLDMSNNYDAFQNFDLSSYDIKAIIKLPDETANIGAAMKPEVLHEEDSFKWDILVGPNFNVHIEDWGANKGLVADKKKQNKELEIYDITYIADEPNFIVYKLALKVKGDKNAPKNVGVPHESYHVFAEKEIDGITYEFRSPDDGYEKVIIELLAKSIRSVVAKK